MKKFFWVAVLMASFLTVLNVPTLAAESDAMEDVNSAIGSLSNRVADVEKVLGLKFFGDMRVRYAFITQAASQAGVSIPDSSMGRFRGRFGVSRKLGDFTGRVRFGTGATAKPWSQNNTFDTAFTNPGIIIDTASLTWEPNFATGVALTAGKMANPLTRTSITWDPDIQPEGLALEIKKYDFTLRATYFELQNLFASGTTFGNMDLFMDNLQLEYAYKFDSDTSVGVFVGYEYIPNSTLIMSSGVSTVLGKNPITGFGGVTDPGGVARDWNNVEGMVIFKHKIGPVPFKWYFHLTDNLNGMNLPISGGVYSAIFTNRYACLGGVDIGTLSTPGDLAGNLYVASLDPNANLPFLTDDDPGETNRQYVYGSLSFLAEPGVTLKLSQWAVNREYYAVSGVGAANALGGSSQSPEFVTYADCLLSL